MVEVAYDPAQSLKRGKATDQTIIASEGVRITALLLKLSTKQSIQLGSVRDWAPDLELDPAVTLRPAFLSGVTLSVPIPEHFSNKEPDFSIYNGATI